VQRFDLWFTIDGVFGRDHKRLSPLDISHSSLVAFSSAVYHAENENYGCLNKNINIYSINNFSKNSLKSTMQTPPKQPAPKSQMLRDSANSTVVWQLANVSEWIVRL